MPQSEVVLCKGGDIKKRAIRALKMAGGIERIVHRGDRVFIKPNIVDGSPFGSGEVVQMEVVETLVEEVLRAGASEVTVGETRAGRLVTAGNTGTMATYSEAMPKRGAKFLDLTDYPFVEVKVPGPVFFEKVRISKILYENDVFINVPALKTHSVCGITAAFKNLYGLIPTQDKSMYHQLDRVEEAIVDLCKAKRPDLNIVDGTYTTLHLGYRPVEECTETFRLDMTIVGSDPVAVDAVGAEVLGRDPNAIRYLRWAEKSGMGVKDLQKIRILGTPIEKARTKNAVTSLVYANKQTRLLKILSYGACTGCEERVAAHLPSLDARISGDDNHGQKEPIYVVVGPEADARRILKDVGRGAVILCGDCAAPNDRNGLVGFTYIPGCPASMKDLRTAVRKKARSRSKPMPS